MNPKSTAKQIDKLINGATQSIRASQIYSFFDAYTGLIGLNNEGAIVFWDERGDSNKQVLNDVGASSIMERCKSGEYLHLEGGFFIFKNSISKLSIIPTDDGDELVLYSPSRRTICTFLDTHYLDLEKLKQKIANTLENDAQVDWDIYQVQTTSENNI